MKKLFNINVLSENSGVVGLCSGLLWCGVISYQKKLLFYLASACNFAKSCVYLIGGDFALTYEGVLE